MLINVNILEFIVHTMTVTAKINLLILFGLDLTFATFNFGNSIVIVEDDQGVLAINCN